MNVRGLSIAHVKSHLQVLKVMVFNFNMTRIPFNLIPIQIYICSDFPTHFTCPMCLSHQMYRSKKLDEAGQGELNLLPSIYNLMIQL